MRVRAVVHGIALVAGHGSIIPVNFIGASLDAVVGQGGFVAAHLEGETDDLAEALVVFDDEGFGLGGQHEAGVADGHGLGVVDLQGGGLAHGVLLMYRASQASASSVVRRLPSGLPSGTVK